MTMDNENDSKSNTRTQYAYLRCVGTVADAPIKFVITDLAKREHFEAEHNVANAILHFDSSSTANTQQIEQIFSMKFYTLSLA